jgi:hypothetical protein
LKIQITIDVPTERNPIPSTLEVMIVDSSLENCVVNRLWEEIPTFMKSPLHWSSSDGASSFEFHLNQNVHFMVVLRRRSFT